LSFTGISSIVSGGYFTVFKHHDGRYFGVGDSENQQLSQKISDPVTTPLYFPATGDTVVDCSAGFYHTIFLLGNGRVLMCGSQNCGVVGASVGGYVQPQINSPACQIAAGNHFSSILTVDNRLFVAGDAQYETFTQWTQIQWHEPVSIIEMHAGAHHLVMIGRDDTAYGYGSNVEGQLGLGVDKKESQEVISMSVGGLQTEPRDERLRVACGRFFTFFYIAPSNVSIQKHFFKLWSCLTEHRGLDDVDVHFK
jgi:alpha-tubulin suppressor-like RCC1 family protein